MVLANTCIVAGLVWDISWHMTIGRDTFWTPAHLLIYTGGAMAAGVSGLEVLRRWRLGAAAPADTPILHIQIHTAIFIQNTIPPQISLKGRWYQEIICHQNIRRILSHNKLAAIRVIE